MTGYAQYTKSAITQLNYRFYVRNFLPSPRCEKLTNKDLINMQSVIHIHTINKMLRISVEKVIIVTQNASHQSPTFLTYNYDSRLLQTFVRNREQTVHYSSQFSRYQSTTFMLKKPAENSPDKQETSPAILFQFQEPLSNQRN